MYVYYITVNLVPEQGVFVKNVFKFGAPFLCLMVNLFQLPEGRGLRFGIQ